MELEDGSDPLLSRSADSGAISPAREVTRFITFKSHYPCLPFSTLPFRLEKQHQECTYVEQTPG
jgi:hypothetical protein